MLISCLGIDPTGRTKYFKRTLIEYFGETSPHVDLGSRGQAVESGRRRRCINLMLEGGSLISPYYVSGVPMAGSQTLAA